MRKLLAFLSPSLLLVPAVALAVNFTDRGDRYSDISSLSVAERVAVSVLTNAGAISGNPDSRFSPNRTVNRAEFLKIALLSAGTEISTPTNDCFPDVKLGQWYTQYICEAKERGIVQGEPDGNFRPARPVNYAEAVKMLVTLHGYSLPLPPPNERWMWYRGYILAAESHGVSLPGDIAPDRLLTRGQAARLAAAFHAQSEGQLEEYRDLEAGRMSSSSSSRTSSMSSSSRSSTSSVSSMSSSSRSSTSSVGSNSSFDPLDDNAVTTSTFVQLGKTTLILGSVQAFSSTEPVDITDITIHMDGSTAAIDAFLVYDTSDGRLIGRATRVGTDFHLDIPSGSYVLDRRVQRSLYVRAQLAPYDRVQSSGEQFTIDDITLEGTGQWSTDEYSATLTSQNFPTVETSRSHITAISNTGQTEAPLFSGTSLPILKMRVQGTVGDGAAVLRVTQLIFRVSSENVALSNIQLITPNSGLSTGCSMVGNAITCSGIPATIGDVQSQRDFELRADVTVTPGAQNARLQVYIQNGGTPSTPGDITWTDGEATFTWLPTNTPVLVGTSYDLE